MKTPNVTVKGKEYLPTVINTDILGTDIIRPIPEKERSEYSKTIKPKLTRAESFFYEVAALKPDSPISVLVEYILKEKPYPGRSERYAKRPTEFIREYFSYLRKVGYVAIYREAPVNPESAPEKAAPSKAASSKVPARRVPPKASPKA